MKAFIEYPSAGKGRIEITSEFVVETKAHSLAESMGRIVDSKQIKSVYVATLEEDRDYWDERMENEST